LLPCTDGIALIFPQEIVEYGRVPAGPNRSPTRLPVVSPPFRALLQWVKVKNIEIKIPPKNIWDAPFPKVREPRVYQRHFNRLVAASPAPLPLEELDRLKRLASGQELPKPPRRKLPLSEGSRKTEAINNERPHKMSPRSWRRVYQKILDQSVALVFHEETDQWKVIAKDLQALPEMDQEEGEDFEIPEDPTRKVSLRGQPWPW
jgi:hypothetical protein